MAWAKRGTANTNAELIADYIDDVQTIPNTEDFPTGANVLVVEDGSIYTLSVGDPTDVLTREWTKI